MTLHRLGILVAAAMTLLPAAPAAGQADGVHYDPTSPAGREYALPLDSTRSELSGDGPRPSTGSSAPRAPSAGGAPRFGVGVAPPKVTNRPPAGSKLGAGDPEPDGSSQSAGLPQVHSVADRPLAEVVGAGSGARSKTGFIFAGGVLAGAGLLALLGRRRRASRT